MEIPQIDSNTLSVYIVCTWELLFTPFLRLKQIGLAYFQNYFNIESAVCQDMTFKDLWLIFFVFFWGGGEFWGIFLLLAVSTSHAGYGLK